MRAVFPAAFPQKRTLMMRSPSPRATIIVWKFGAAHHDQQRMKYKSAKNVNAKLPGLNKKFLRLLLNWLALILDGCLVEAYVEI